MVPFELQRASPLAFSRRLECGAISVLIVHLCCVGVFAANGPLQTWTRITSGTSGLHMLDAAYGNGVFVATGLRGEILISSDEGQTWSNVASNVNAWLHDIDFVMGRFLVVGKEGTILTSENGTDWEQIDSGTTKYLRRLELIEGILIATGDDGAFLVSEDGFAWVSMDLPTREKVKGIAHLNGVWIVADFGHGYWRSIDFENWVFHIIPAPVQFRVDDILVLNERFVAWFGKGTYHAFPEFTGFMVSLDGIEWVEVTHGEALFPPNPPILEFGEYKIGGHIDRLGIAYYSTDGENWDGRSFDAFSGNTIVSVGGEFIHVSSDGLNFEERRKSARLPLEHTVMRDGIFYTIYDGAYFARSVDGVEWEMIESEFPASIVDVSVIDFLEDRFFVRTRSDGIVRLFISDDFVEWAEIVIGKYSNSPQVKHAGEYFIIFNDSGSRLNTVNVPRYAISQNGIEWEPLEIPSFGVKPKLDDIVFGNSRYVVIGDISEVSSKNTAYSQDLINWTALDWKAFTESAQAVHPEDLFFLANRFFAPGLNQHFWTSEDGKNWEVTDLPVPLSASNMVEENGILFMFFRNTTDLYLTSEDGMHWSVVPLQKRWKWAVTDYFDGRFYSVNDSEILVSGSITKAPQISAVSGIMDLFAGEFAKVFLSATGSRPRSYQWYRGSSGDTTDPVSGANGFFLVTEPLLEDSSFWVRVINGEGSADSEATEIRVRNDPLGHGFLEGQALYDGWRYSDVYGFFQTALFPWIYQLTHGFQFILMGDDPDDVFLFDSQLRDWWYSETEVYPIFYSFERRTWNYYFPSSIEPRRFLDFSANAEWTAPAN